MSRILLVDDSPSVLMTLTMFMEDLGHTVTTANTFSTAMGYVTTATRDGITVVFTDYELNDRKGNGAQIALAAKEMGIEKVFIHTSEPQAALEAINGAPGIRVVEKILSNFRATLEEYFGSNESE